MKTEQKITIEQADTAINKLIRGQQINQDTHDMLHACRLALTERAKKADDLEKENEVLKNKVRDLETLLSLKEEE